MSKHHTLMDVKEMSSVADGEEFFSSFTKCPNHPDREAEFYCRGHDAVVCAACFSIGLHKQCLVVEVTNESAAAGKLAEETKQLIEQMKAATDHLDKLQTLRKENKINLKKKLKEIRDKSQQVRDQVVELLENVVRHVTDVTKQIELETADKLDADMSRVLKVKELIEEKLAHLHAIEQHGSQRHKFISAHRIKTQYDEIDEKIFAEDNRIKTIDAELKIADGIRKLIENSDVSELARVQVGEGESCHRHLPAISNFLRDRQLVRAEEHSVRTSAGVATHKDGRVILCDQYGEYLCLYNPSSRTMLKLSLPGLTSATSIDDSRIAVSIPGKKTICIVTVGAELRLEKRFNTESKPLSIVALSTGQLAVSWDGPPAVSMVDVSGTDIVQISRINLDGTGRELKSFNYIAVDERRQRLILSGGGDNAVHCFEYTGKHVFTYTDPNLTGPQGVALDRCNNIYVCEYNHGTIHKLTPSGSQISVVKVDSSKVQAISSSNDSTGFWVSVSPDSGAGILFGNVSINKLLYFRLDGKS